MELVTEPGVRPVNIIPDVWVVSLLCWVTNKVCVCGSIYLPFWPAMAAIAAVWSVWAALGREKCYVWLSHRQSFPIPTLLFSYCLSFCSTCPTSAFFLPSFLHVFCCVNLKGIHGRKPTLTLLVSWRLWKGLWWKNNPLRSGAISVL